MNVQKKLALNARHSVEIPPTLFKDCVAIGEKERHSGGSRNPVFDFFQFLEILDASFRWHDELRYNLFRKGGQGEFME